MPKRNRIAQLLLLCLLVAFVFWLRTSNTKEYSSLSALNEQQKAQGFVPIGRFGENWPARIIEVHEQDDRIEFKRSNGQPHSYKGFEGYRLKMIRLSSRSGAEVIVVYRSEPLDTPPDMERDDKPVVRRI